ncbi:hypothetical protein FHS91_001081 [Sphingobium xanthum]|uniref:hypothetical protein n=1 Tax=Sphingobium xanthum TaxID=1387165 RepID=UPI001C8BEFA1|nr:hypothetical protein [Sphingobium xanthum]
MPNTAAASGKVSGAASADPVSVFDCALAIVPMNGAISVMAPTATRLASLVFPTNAECIPSPVSSPDPILRKSTVRDKPGYRQGTSLELPPNRCHHRGNLTFL